MRSEIATGAVCIAAVDRVDRILLADPIKCWPQPTGLWPGDKLIAHRPAVLVDSGLDVRGRVVGPGQFLQARQDG
jgi:hypothetical protein